MATQCHNRDEWEKLVLAKYPQARFDKHGKQYRYATEARIPASWDRGLIPSRKVGEFLPVMTIASAMPSLPSQSGNGEGWVA